MTLDDLERLKRHSCRDEKIYRAHQKNLNENRFILSVAKCRPMILVSRNIIHADIHWASSVKERQATAGLLSQAINCVSYVATIIIIIIIADEKDLQRS